MNILINKFDVSSNGKKHAYFRDSSERNINFQNE